MPIFKYVINIVWQIMGVNMSKLQIGLIRHFTTKFDDMLYPIGDSGINNLMMTQEIHFPTVLAPFFLSKHVLTHIMGH